MINRIIRLTLCCSLLFCTSCMQYTSIFHRNTGFATCKLACEKTLAHCAKTCRNNCDRCTRAAAIMTTAKYNRYIQQQIIKGKIIALQLNSFRDPLQCRKMTCNCMADYQICVQACGSVETPKRLQHIPLCS